MLLNRFNLILAFAFVLVLALLVLARVDHSQPNYQIHLGDDMAYSPAYSSFEANPNFANGRTMQSPVPGTIARNTQSFHFEATPQDAMRAGEQLANPFNLDTEQGIASAERGQAVFQVFCTACHGADGAGNGPVAKRGFPPPPSLLTGKSRTMKDGQLLHILTLGQNSMPKFAAQLPLGHRWDVINYIRQLQQQAPQPETKASTKISPPAKQATNPPSKTNPITQPDSIVPAEADTESKP